MNDETIAKAMIAAALIQSKTVDLTGIHDWTAAKHTDHALARLREATDKVYFAITVVMTQ